MVIAVEAYKIAYMPLPKAACTSVKAALALADPTVDVTSAQLEEDPHQVHAIYKTARFRKHRWAQYESYWRFAVVRDPLKRLLSAYTDLVVKRGDLRNSPRLAKRQAELPLDPDPDFFFQHLEDYKQEASVVKHHVLPAHLFVGPKPRWFDRIYRTEELGRLEQDLSLRTGKNLGIPRYNTSGTKLSFDSLQPKTQDVIRQYLAPEYAQLDEYYTSPW